MRKIFPAVLLIFMLSLIVVSAAQAQSSQQTLNQYISDLQKNPGDHALREKIIKHVLAMRPAPATPEEADRYMARGAAAVKGAKTEKDFQDAAAELEKASLAAPWLPAIYYNLGITQDKAGKYKDAIQSLKLYLLAAPDAPDAKAVKNLVYEIEYRQEKVAKESSPQTLAEKKQKTYEQWLRELNGARFMGTSRRFETYRENELTVRGNMLFWRLRVISYGPGVVREIPEGQWYNGELMQIEGRQARSILPIINFVNDIFTISEDGNSITHVEQPSGGGTFIYYRK